MSQSEPCSTNEPQVVIPQHWQIRSGEVILREPPSKPAWVIGDLLLKESGTLVSGHPHSCKSLNWLCAALESVTSHKVWNYFPSPEVNRVLYVETEDPQMVVENRVRQFAAGLKITADKLADRFYLAVTGPFDLLESELAINKLIEETHPDWLVLSTLQGLLNGVDWKEQSQMGPVNAVMVRLSRKCPLVLITHSPWDRTAKRAAGTVTQAANFLTTIHFEKVIDKNEIVTTVTTDSKLGSEVPAFRLSLSTEIVDDTSEVRRVFYQETTMRTRVIDYIKSHPTAPPAEVAQMIGCSERYVRKVMAEN